jgi:hypothetical protein
MSKITLVLDEEEVIEIKNAIRALGYQSLTRLPQPLINFYDRLENALVNHWQDKNLS